MPTYLKLCKKSILNVFLVWKGAPHIVVSMLETSEKYDSVF